MNLSFSIWDGTVRLSFSIHFISILLYRLFHSVSFVLSHSLSLNLNFLLFLRSELVTTQTYSSDF